jgi:two-component system response regulator VicR
MKKKIMIVDDEQDHVKSLKQFLEHKNEYDVTGVSSGMECFKLLKDNQIPDLIMLDIVMPGMSGWDVFDELKENTKWKRIPIIFLTSLKDEYNEKFGNLFTADYIKKPYDLEDLKKRIDSVLNSEN